MRYQTSLLSIKTLSTRSSRCAAGWLPAPPRSRDPRLTLAQRREPTRALTGDERLKTSVDKGGLLLDSGQSASFLEQQLIQDDGRSHVHDYGSREHIEQPEE